MTTQEWRSFLKYFRESFPNLAAKVEEAGAETAAAWKRSLGACEFADCKSAVDAMMDGKLDVPMQWSLIPPVIRRYAEKMAAQRRPQERVLPPQRAYRGRHSMVAMLACIRECHKAGMTNEAALEVVNERFPIEPEDETPFRCLTCQDSGQVLVWSYASVEAAAGGFPVKRYRSSVLCTCDAGNGLQLPADRFTDQSSVRPMERYDHSKYCFYGRGEVQRLLDWIDDKRRRVA